MYQPLITFCPHPAIFTQVLTIFVEYRMRLGIVKSEMRFRFASALTFHYICEFSNIKIRFNRYKFYAVKCIIMSLFVHKE